LDNADNLDLIPEYLPTGGNGHIILTTREQAVGPLAVTIVVEKMDDQEGMLLLLRRAKVLASRDPLTKASPADQNQARAIIKVLDGLPLALDQAGAYIEETRCSLSSYLTLFRTHRQALLQRRGRFSTEHPESVATTWSLSFEQVQHQSQAAAELLRLCAFLDADAIPEEIITQGASQLGPLLELLVSDQFMLDEAIALLQRYSLVRRTTATKTLSVHRLVQAVLKDRLEEQTRHLWAECTVRAVNQAFPDVIDVSVWPQCARYLPHALSCADLIGQYGLELPEVAQLLNKTASYLDDRALYEQAEPLLKRALSISEKKLGPEHPSTATVRENYAALLRDM